MTPEVKAAAPRGAWSLPAYRRLWLANTADAWAVSLLPIAVALALVRDGGGIEALGPVLAAKTLGFVLATVPGGMAADRWSRRAMMRWACVVRAAAAAVLPFGLGSSTWLTVACVALAGAGEGAFRPSYQAMVGDVVPEPQRQSANALSTITFRLALVLAPGVATGLTLLAGPVAVVLAAGALWCLAAFAVTALPARTAEPGPPESTIGQFLAGLREAKRHPWFMAGLAMLTLVLSIGEATQLVLLPVISTDRFGTEAVYAAALTGYSIGALAAGAVMTRWRPRRQGLVAVLGLALYAAIPLALALSPSPWPVVLAYVAAGMGMELFNVPWFGALQREVPAPLLARVSALDFLVSYSLSPLGLAMVPFAVNAFGVHAMLLGTTVVVLLACLSTLAVPGMARFTSPSRRPAAEPPASVRAEKGSESCKADQ